MAIECSTRDRRFCVKGNKIQDHRVFIVKSSDKIPSFLSEKLVVMYGQRWILGFVIQSQVSRSLRVTKGSGRLGKITRGYS